MKKILLFILALSVASMLYAQGEVEIKDGTPFMYVYMEFQGPHHEGLPEKFGIFIQELRNQELLPKISGNSFSILFDSPLLVVGRDKVWGLGFKIQKDASVQAPLIKRKFDYPKVVTIISKGPYETALGNAQNIIIPYIEEKGLEVVGPPIEIWLGNPSEDKPEDLGVEIIIPIREPEK